MRFATCAFAVALVLHVPSIARATLSAEEIVRKSMDQQVFRFKGAEMRIDMRLTDKRGDKRDRTLFVRTLRRQGISKTLARVHAPADVAGMGFLFLQNPKGGDDQYMYLPAVKMVKRVVGAQKNAKFLGSQFTYSDLEWRAIEDASYVSEADEMVGSDACYVIAAKPKGTSAYSSLKLWVRKSDFTMLRVKYFDRKERLKKVLFVKRVERVDGAMVATRLKMKDVTSGDVTLLAVSQIVVSDKLAPEQFTVRELNKQ